MNRSIQVTRSSMPYFEEYIVEIKDLWNSRWLTNMGVKHKKLEGLITDKTSAIVPVHVYGNICDVQEREITKEPARSRRNKPLDGTNI